MFSLVSYHICNVQILYRSIGLFTSNIMHNIQNLVVTQKCRYHHTTKTSTECFIGIEKKLTDVLSSPGNLQYNPRLAPWLSPQAKPQSDPLNQVLAHSLAWSSLRIPAPRLSLPHPSLTSPSLGGHVAFSKESSHHGKLNLNGITPTWLYLAHSASFLDFQGQVGSGGLK